MAHSLLINLKPTSEYFEIPYQKESTISNLIQQVCSQSQFLSEYNSDDYYMAINKSDTLENNLTVEQAGLYKLNGNIRLDVCIKTKVLMQRISETRVKFWDAPYTQPQCKSSTNNENDSFVTQTITVDPLKYGDVHFLICGAPKVGKSTLINALCGFPVAKVSPLGLDVCTKEKTYYQLNNIYFWDTPGIQNWSQAETDKYFNLFFERSNPLCMFYCASPGSFAKLQNVKMLLDKCIHQKAIFCILVVTNMFASNERQAIFNDFKNLLRNYIDNDALIRQEENIWYYGHIGLCTMVNSQEYIDEDTNQCRPQQGIHELVLAVIKSLSGTSKLSGWLQTIEQNRQFWLENQHELVKLVSTASSV